MATYFPLPSFRLILQPERTSVRSNLTPALGATLPLSESLLRLENVCNFATGRIHFSFHEFDLPLSD